MNTKENLQNKIFNATKWSSLTEIAAKLVTPITNMILARILIPEAFGIIAIITMILSLADMFTDAGFQKYLVQREFKNEVEKYRFANVAFWSNLFMSILLWLGIIIFRNEIAFLVGNPELGSVIAIACGQLILTSFSSIQMALYRRDFDFKTLFWIRIITVFIPFAITIPLALLGFSYWALVIGSITMQFVNAIILTVKSRWKPTLYYNFDILKKMFSFSVWSLIEAMSIWLTVWIDIFIIGNILNEYYLGLYTTSTTMVNALMALVTASIVPVLFSALSRVQNDSESFNRLYFKAQRMVSVLVFPMGIGIYIYSDLATSIFLGEQWNEASEIIGIWALTSAIMIVFGNFCSEAYRAKGLPKLSFFAQVLHLIFLIPILLFFSQYSFWILIFARSLIRVQAIIVHFIFMKFIIGISITSTFRNIFPTLICSLIMGILGFFLNSYDYGVLWDVCSIILCILLYLALLVQFKDIRKEVLSIISRLLPVNFVLQFSKK